MLVPVKGQGLDQPFGSTLCWRWLKGTELGALTPLGGQSCSDQAFGPGCPFSVPAAALMLMSCSNQNPTRFGFARSVFNYAALAPQGLCGIRNRAGKAGAPLSW